MYFIFIAKEFYVLFTFCQVWGDDPTVKELEDYAAKLFNKEAACFLSSGTQGNLISVMVHCKPGDEMILGNSKKIL